jgi:hypothetical protein
MSIDTGPSRADRRARRLKIFQPATLVRGGRTQRIHLLNVSATGFLGHAEDEVPTSSLVRLECLGVVRNAVVRWSDGRRFGLLLDRTLNADQIGLLTGSLRP